MTMEQGRREASTTPAAPRALQELTETVQRSRLGGPFYVLLWGLAGLAAGLAQRAPLGFALMGLVFVGFTVARFRTRTLPAGASEAAVAQRLDAVWAVVLLNAAVWGAASAWLLLTSPDESARNVAAICSYAFSTAFAHNFCMRLYRTFAAVAMLYLPTLGAFIAIGTRWEFVLVGMLYLVYIALATRRGHAEYLQRLDLEDELRHQRDLFQRQSQRDSLTGLPNRRHFGAVLEQWVEESRASPRSFALLILDLDWFKAVNDRHGHTVGDACLRAFAGELSSTFARAGDLPARLGGEEFAVLMHDCGLEQARGRAEDFRQSLAGRPLPLENFALGLTVSIGAGAFDPSLHASADAFFHAVDTALYRAKAAGRNRVRMAQPTD
jgi:diguanylate cyclase (GGDEF)-like protein